MATLGHYHVATTYYDFENTDRWILGRIKEKIIFNEREIR
jgi:hypothetical protein